MIDGRLYLNEKTGAKIRSKQLMEDEKFEYYNIDVVSYADVTVEELVRFFISRIDPKTNGTIWFIDETEQAAYKGTNVQILCSYYGENLSCFSSSKANVLERFTRFALVKIPKIFGCKNRNLILFI